MFSLAKIAAILAFASFAIALPRPHDGCATLTKRHDGDGPCFILDRRQMEGHHMDMGTPIPAAHDMTSSSRAPQGMDHSQMQHPTKRHGPDEDGDSSMAGMPGMAATATKPAPVTSPAATPAAAAPMAGMAGMHMKRHDNCSHVVNHDGESGC